MTAIIPMTNVTSGDLLVAFHCSAGVGSQWHGLRERLGAGYLCRTPDMRGMPHAGHRRDRRFFSVAHEAAPSLAAIDLHDGPVHLVGHSYGGVVALHLAAARRERVASLTLYEPSAFYLLEEMGSAGQVACAEIAAVAASLRQSLLRKDLHEAAQGFVDYWCGSGAFRATRPEAREDIAASMPKVDLEFQAVFDETLKGGDFARFPFSVLIIRGDASPDPVRRIADHLAHRIASAAIKVIAGAGHMAPLTHPGIVAGSMARHIESAAVTSGWRVPQTMS